MTALSTPSRSVVEIVRAAQLLEGAGFAVRRPVPSPVRDAVGPFLMLDHFGPTDYDPGEAVGAPDHPHYGFETLTYLLEGRGLHRDSLGNVAHTGPGEAQWMRAGRGIVHDEGPDEAILRDGGRMNGFQFWIALPPAHRRDAPDYRTIAAGDIPKLALGAATLHLLAGAADGATGPVSGPARPWLAHLALPAGARALVPVPADAELAAYVAAGAPVAAGRPLAEGEMALLASGGDAVAIAADNVAADVILFGGAALEAPVLRYGPFVAGSREELVQAFRDYQEGRMGRIDFGLPVP